LKADFPPNRLSAEEIFSRFKALKLCEGLFEFKWFWPYWSLWWSVRKTVNSYLNSPTGEGSSMGKDVFYRLKNSPFICWRMHMWLLVHRFVKVTSKDSDVADTSSRYLVFDDTTLPKTGKRMEKIGKVWDHVTNRYVLGFKLLVMMYWDGKSAIPLDFSFHREKGKKQERPFGMTRKEIRK
jgi:hypothetical protein